MENPSERALFDALASLKFLKGEGISGPSQYHCVLFPVVEYVEYDVESGEVSNMNFLDYGGNFKFTLDGVDVEAMIELLEKLIQFSLEGGDIDNFLDKLSKYPEKVPEKEVEYTDMHTIYYDADGNIVREEILP
jgi:hypothetical protein